MKYCFLSSYPSFSCIGGACEDTCCSRWCVVVDDKAKAYYESLPGELGDRARAALTVDDEGETCLSFDTGFCPLLTEEGLCSLQKAYGEEALCAVCGRYPRFRYEYGNLTQEGASISCPEACRLIVNTPTALALREDDAPPSLNDLDAQRYLSFKLGMETALAITSDEELSLKEKLVGLLMFTEVLELTADSDYAADWCALWKDSEKRRERIPAVRSKGLSCLAKPYYTKLRLLFGGMEYLREEDREAVRSCREPALIGDEEIGARLLGYYVFKYFLQAAYDGKLLEKAQLAVCSVLIIGSLSQGTADKAELVKAASRFSRETEHSEENLNRFYRHCGKKLQRSLYRLLT